MTASVPDRSSSGGPSPQDDLLVMLYEEHAQSLLLFVLRLTGGDRQRAEDIVQETLLRAWRNAHKLQAQRHSTLRPWLVTVARRIAIDHHRATTARPPEELGEDVESAGIADETDRLLQLMTVTDAMRTLSRPHREILIETYFRERTVSEAAQVLGLPLGTAKSRVYYALRAMKDSLKELGVTG